VVLTAIGFGLLSGLATFLAALKWQAGLSNAQDPEAAPDGWYAILFKSKTYLLVGAAIIYTVIDSMAEGDDAPARAACEGSPKTSFPTSMLLIVPMGLVGCLLAALATFLIKLISINFMFMTFYLEISMTEIMTGMLVALLMGLAASFMVLRRLTKEDAVAP
jgi:hypothetical protein